jgi:hypothetical protein
MSANGTAPNAKTEAKEGGCASLRASATDALKRRLPQLGFSMSGFVG